MPIPLEHIQERLSVAYVNAVVSRAGYCLYTPDATEYGTDCFVQEIRRLPNGRYRSTGFILSLQIKATIIYDATDDEIIYDMRLDAYNKLAEWQGPSPCLLVLLCLPKDENDWLSLSEEALLLRRCCYWARIVGPPSENRSTQRIRIARSQILDTAAVDLLFETFVRGGG